MMARSTSRRTITVSVCGGVLALVCSGALISRSIKLNRDTTINLLLVGLAAAGLALVIWLVPKLQSSGIGTAGTKERFDSESDARKSLVQLIGGLAFLATFYVSWSNFALEREKAANDFALEREKATTEEFTKAVEQLSSADLPIRVGGAYGLERVSRSSPNEYQDVMDVLTEWVRSTNQTDFENRTFGAPSLIPRADEDRQRIIRILGRRTILSTGRDDALRLNNADLRGVSAQDGHFEWTNFDDSKLDSATFYRAHLAHAAFINSHCAVLIIPDPDLKKRNAVQLAQVEEAAPQKCAIPGILSNQLRSVSFTLADLRDAILSGGDFRGASFNDANLAGANLEGAQLQRAVFLNADLSGAVFRGAHIEGANFSGAKGVTSSTLAGAVSNECTVIPK